MIKLYFHHTPNSRKVALFLEEAGLPYEIVPVDILKGEQHRPEFRAMNPNGKVPAIVDGGVVVFDSNAILLHLAEKTGQFLGEPRNRPALLSWLMFVASGLGPFSGQAAHFSQIHADSHYATNRYRRELERHYEVLDGRLERQAYLVGDSYTIVDMSAWGWVDRAGFNLKEDAPLERWPNLKRWFGTIDGRPAASRARLVGSDATLKTEFDEDTLRALFPQNFPEVA
jgi:GSH-dependent disulfide-bond oxidoreductase